MSDTENMEEMGGRKKEPNYKEIEEFLTSKRYPSRMKNDSGSKKNFRVQCKRFCLIDNELHYNYKICQKVAIGPDVLRVIKNKEDRKKLLMIAHEGLGEKKEAKGHIGRDKTLWKLIESGMWWPCMNREVRSYVSSCESCQKTLTEMDKAAPELHPTPFPAESKMDQSDCNSSVNWQNVFIKEECDEDDFLEAEEEEAQLPSIETCVVQPYPTNFITNGKVEQEDPAIDDSDKTMEEYSSLLINSCDINIHKTIKTEELPSENSDVRDEIEFWDNLNMIGSAAKTVEKSSNDQENTNVVDVEMENEDSVEEIQDESESSVSFSLTPYSKVYKCEHCDKTFFHAPNLRRHLSIHFKKKTLSRKYNCKKCGKTFSRQEACNRHLQVGCEERPHKCHVCGKGFPRVYELNRHIQVHSQKKPFKCKKCGKGFGDRSYFKKHVENHSKIHECDICKKMFKKAKNLKDHLKIHEEERPVVGRDEENPPDLEETASFTEPLELDDVIQQECNASDPDADVMPEEVERPTEIAGPGEIKEVTISPENFSESDSNIYLGHFIQVNHSVESDTENEKESCINLNSRKNLKKISKNLGEKKKLHKCVKCGETFLRHVHLAKHKRIHFAEKTHKCNVCGKAFTRKSYLKTHSAVHAITRPHECDDECKQTCIQQQSLTAHLRVQSIEESFYKKESFYTCVFCDKAFEEEENLTLHLQTHYQWNDVATGNTTSNIERSDLKPEIRPRLAVVRSRGKKIKKPFKCVRCTKTFSKEIALRVHLKNHKLESCKICGKKFYEISLKRHVNAVHRDNAHHCTECEKSFHDAKSLKLHLLKKPFKCDLCDKAFHASTAFSKHALFHKEERPYKCNQCEKSYFTKSNYTHHMVVHSAKREHVCDKCGKTFVFEKYLNDHIEATSGKPIYKCEECGVGRHGIISLNKHLVLEHCIYKCLMCDDAKTGSRISIFRHIKDHEFQNGRASKKAKKIEPEDNDETWLPK